MKVKKLPGVIEITEASEQELSQATASLTFTRAVYVPKFNKEVPVTYCFLHKKRFPSGLIGEVSKFVKLEIEDGYDDFPLPTLSQKVKLTKPQETVVKRALQYPAALIHSAVSTGKTYMATAIAASFNIPFVYLSHRKVIVEQTFKLMRKLLPDVSIGLRVGGVKIDGESVCSTFQSVENFNTNLLLVDEVHHLPARLFSKVFLECPAVYRYGFTGTLTGRSDGLDFVVPAFFDNQIVEGISLVEAEKLKLTSPFTVVLIVVNEKKRIRRYDDYIEAEENFIVKSDLRNQLISGLASLNEESVTLILVRRVEHGKILCDMIPGSLFICGASSSRARAKAVSLSRGVLIATSVFDEGLSDKEISVIINAAGGKSHLQINQRLGRGLRYKAGKRLVVFDFVDLGHPMLKKHAYSRYKFYRKHSKKVLLIDKSGRELSPKEVF